jgi:hypothetical protein
MLVVLFANFAFYIYVISQFPTYINDVVIYSIASVLLNVEGFLLALTSQIQQKERQASVLVGLTAILFSIITISKAYFESIQLKYLSYAPTTALFESDILIFGMFVGVYGVSILVPGRRRSRIRRLR